jgi:NADH:ubiquinone oxidoreductase subunit E
MEVVICIGSSCHVKGSQKVVQVLKDLIAKHGLEDRVNLKGSFCMGGCTNGVSVSIDGEILSITPDTVEVGFHHILQKLSQLGLAY